MPTAARTHRQTINARRPRRQRDDRPSAAARGYGGKRWHRLRMQTFGRDDYVCQSCGQVCTLNATDAGQRPHCDHIRPKVRGGADVLDNLQTLCGRCHGGKTRKERINQDIDIRNGGL